MKRKARMTFLLCLLAASASMTGCKSLERPVLQAYAPTLPSTPLKTGLRAHFFGTSTVLITDGTTSIMIDGFLSRPGVGDLIGGTQPDEERIGRALEAAGITKIDHVVVAHSHHDHAMDAPTIAKKYKAKLVGSESTWNIARGVGLEKEAMHIPTHLERYEAGDFTITFFHQTEHAPTFPVLEWLLDGEIRAPLYPPARVWNYKFGGNYTFLLEHRELPTRILVVPSAKEPLQLEGKEAHVVFLSIGNLHRQKNAEIEKYWKEAVTDTGAKLVIPVHWDSFFRPLDEPLTSVPAILDNTACAMETLTYLARGEVEIWFMPLFKPVLMSALPPPMTEKEAARARESARDPFTEGCRKGRE